MPESNGGLYATFICYGGQHHVGHTQNQLRAAAVSIVGLMIGPPLQYQNVNPSLYYNS